MSMQRWMRRLIPVAAAVAAFAGSASVAAAQSRLIMQPRVMDQMDGVELFEWSGQVDREVQVVMRGSNLWTNNIGQTEFPRARSRTYGRLPNQDGQVTVQLLNGRGTVDVIQQPSRQNGYTTVVRIQDPRGGSGDYRLAAYWQGFSNGDVFSDDRNNRNDRNRDDRDARSRDDREDRNDRRARDDREDRNDRRVRDRMRDRHRGRGHDDDDDDGR